MLQPLRLAFAAIVLSVLTCGVAAQAPAVIPYGQGCGPVLTGQVTPNGNTLRFAFTVTNGTPGGRVLLIVGVNELALPLPYTSCFLLTEIAFSQQHLLDASGSFTWSHALASTFSGYARIQFIEVDFNAPGGLAFYPSNGVHMIVP
ncbi:MAG: hypothetical protein IPM29_05615 [Planctomycetes bacterium]|nr:hypothetical protein [Planctomycetota bacterium]